MLKISVVTILISCLLLTCCTSWETVQSVEPNSTIKITTNEDKVIEMSEWTEQPEYFEGFAGETKREGNLILKYQTKVYKSDIKMLEEQKYDGDKTLLFSIGAVIGIAGIIFFLGALTVGWI
jgi:hypothetical protein